MKRIISVIKFLASHYLAFLGQADKLFSKGNGNFLGLIKMITEFYAILQEHLRKIKSHKVSDQCLNKKIQNQIIQRLASEIKKSIISNYQNAKYYSVIVDCTTEVAHQEQLTLTFRFYNCKSFAIDKYFIGFDDVNRTTGRVLTETFLKHLTDPGPDLSSFRGQSYDNEANRKGFIMECKRE